MNNKESISDIETDDEGSWNSDDEREWNLLVASQSGNPPPGVHLFRPASPELMRSRQLFDAICGGPPCQYAPKASL